MVFLKKQEIPLLYTIQYAVQLKDLYASQIFSINFRKKKTYDKEYGNSPMNTKEFLHSGGVIRLNCVLVQLEQFFILGEYTK